MKIKSLILALALLGAGVQTSNLLVTNLEHPHKNMDENLETPMQNNLIGGLAGYDSIGDHIYSSKINPEEKATYLKFNWNVTDSENDAPRVDEIDMDTVTIRRVNPDGTQHDTLKVYEAPIDTYVGSSSDSGNDISGATWIVELPDELSYDWNTEITVYDLLEDTYGLNISFKTLEGNEYGFTSNFSEVHDGEISVLAKGNEIIDTNLIEFENGDETIDPSLNFNFKFKNGSAFNAQGENHSDFGLIQNENDVLDWMSKSNGRIKIKVEYVSSASASSSYDNLNNNPYIHDGELIPIGGEQDSNGFYTGNNFYFDDLNEIAIINSVDAPISGTGDSAYSKTGEAIVDLTIPLERNRVYKNVSISMDAGQTWEIIGGTSNEYTTNPALISKDDISTSFEWDDSSKIIRYNLTINQVSDKEIFDPSKIIFNDFKISATSTIDGSSRVINSNVISPKSTILDKGEITYSWELNLEPESGTKYNLDTNVQYDGSSGIIELSNESFEHIIEPEPARPIEQEDLVQFDVYNVVSNSADFDIKIKMPAYDNHYETTELNKIEIIDKYSDDEVLYSDDDISATEDVFSATGKIINLTPGTEYRLAIVLTYNDSNSIEFDLTKDVSTPKANAEQVDPSNITLTSTNPDKYETNGEINWEIDLPVSSTTEDTIIEDVRLVDEFGAPITENITYTDRTKSTGTITLENLDYNQTLNYKLEVKTNAGQSYVASESSTSIVVGKGAPQAISLNKFELKTDSITSDSAIFEYELNIPNNDNYEETKLESVELINITNDNSIAATSMETSGTLEATGLNPYEDYEFKLRTTTNVIADNDWDENIISIQTNKASPKQIDSSDIVITSNEPGKDETTATLEWDINTLTSVEYEPTKIRDVRLLDEDGNEVIENITYTDREKTLGTITLENLDFNTIYKYSFEVKTNASDEYIKYGSEIIINVEKGSAQNSLVPAIRVEKNGDSSANVYYDIRIPNDDRYDSTIIEKVSLLNNGAQFENSGNTYVHESNEWGVGNDVGDHIEYSGVFEIDGLPLGSEYNFSINIETNVNQVESEVVSYATNKKEARDIISSPIASIKKESGSDGSDIKVLYSVEELEYDEEFNDTTISFVEVINKTDGKSYATNIGNDWSGELEINDLDINSNYNFYVRVHTNANEPNNYIDSTEINYSADMESAKPITSAELSIKELDINKTILHYDISEILHGDNYLDTVVQSVTLINNGEEFIGEGSTPKHDGNLSGDFELTSLEQGVEYNFSILIETNANNMESEPVTIFFEETLVINSVENFNLDSEEAKLTFDSNLVGSPELFEIRYGDKGPFEISFEKIDEPTRILSEKNIEFIVNLDEGQEYILDQFEISNDSGKTWEFVNFDMLVSDNVINGGGYDVSEDGKITNNGFDTGYTLFEDKNGKLEILSPDGSISEPILMTNVHSFPWIWVIIGSLLLIGLIILLILLLRRRNEEKQTRSRVEIHY